MAWIRLSDDYNDHPKFSNISDGAFRLWHQGMGFCRKYKTDGLIPINTVRGLKSYSAKRMSELMTPWQTGENPLWVAVDGFGVRIHDYLDWNLSREEEQSDRDAAAARMRRLRSVSSSPQRSPEHTRERSPDVLGRRGSGSVSEKGSGEKPDAEAVLLERAGRLREELYPEWYRRYRHGARLRLVANTLEFEDALSIVRTWDDARIEKLAKIILTTDEPFIVQTDRSFKIFALKASWADDRLRQAESGAA